MDWLALYRETTRLTRLMDERARLQPPPNVIWIAQWKEKARPARAKELEGRAVVPRRSHRTLGGRNRE